MPRKTGARGSRTLGREPRAVAAAALCSGSTIDRYVVIDRVGAGGMGVVYAAFDPKLDRKVAIKLVRRGMAPELEVRLEREAYGSPPDKTADSPGSTAMNVSFGL